MYCKLILLLGLLIGSSIKAQQNYSDTTCVSEEYCSCNKYEVPAGVMISHTHMKGEWMVSYRMMRMNMSGLLEGSQAINATDVLLNYRTSPDLMQMDMHMLMLMYGLSDKITLMGMFHYTSNYMEMTMPSGTKFHRHSMSTNGLGDMKLYVLWSVIKKSEKEFLLSMGLNLPFGSINAQGAQHSAMYADQRYPYDMQLGSGSFDLMPSLSYIQKKNRITWSVQLGSILRPYYNSNEYKLGNELNFNAWTSLKWLRVISSSLRAEFLYSDKINGRDPSLNSCEEIAANPSNYGGLQAFIHLGSSLNGKRGFLKKNRLSFEYGLPFFQKLNGLQMPTKNLFTTSWSLTF
ncbi:hypothetical protein [Aurantibacillus circumpalustris]|uniref:hypothetical protein n=1 Tax=Aurantibacillus circumpalustris TaxID=3036359 RepID=UPI00295AEDFD|nr:hypothetical protein [Aurantibacillus circumpalustris]